jgi:hypothetical protein
MRPLWVNLGRGGPDIDSLNIKGKIAIADKENIFKSSRKSSSVPQPKKSSEQARCLLQTAVEGSKSSGHWMVGGLGERAPSSDLSQKSQMKNRSTSERIVLLFHPAWDCLRQRKGEYLRCEELQHWKALRDCKRLLRTKSLPPDQDLPNLCSPRPLCQGSVCRGFPQGERCEDRPRGNNLGRTPTD